MSAERSNIAVESLIADHVAVSFRKKASSVRSDTASQIRSRITDHFQFGAPGSEQDNVPPAAKILHDGLIRAFTFLPPQSPALPHDRTEEIVRLQASAQELHRAVASAPGARAPAHVSLLLKRQQFALKNELTEGLGRLEVSLVSITTLALILLDAINYLWALPILALTIGRSWQLDRQCKKRRAKIEEIDAIVQPIAKLSHN